MKKFDVVNDLQVVLITYNRKMRLSHTLQCLFASDSPVAKCAITVLDNYSTDGTGQLLDEIAARHANVRVMHHRRNIGGNANIVRAYESAEKKYIWVICDDDSFDWSKWKPVEVALASDAYDIVYVNNRLTLASPWPNMGYYAFVAAFVPACIYRSSLITSDILQNMYAMIHTWYPQVVLSLHALCNLRCRFFVPDDCVVVHQLLTDAESRVMTEDENVATLTRGMDDEFLHPDLKRMYWHIGFLKAAQIIKDPIERQRVLHDARFDERWDHSYWEYCKFVVWYNRIYKGFSCANCCDYILGLSGRNRFIFCIAVLYALVKHIVKCVLVKLRLWKRK